MNGVALSTVEILERVIDRKIENALNGYKRDNALHRGVKVLRRDKEGVIWVHIPGGAEETPVDLNYAEVSPGDIGTLRFENGFTILEANISSPPVSRANYDIETEHAILMATDPLNATLKSITAKVGRFEKLEADYAEIAELVAQRATIEDLSATNANVRNLIAQNATINGHLEAIDGHITNLTAEDVTINGLLTAANADIANLQAADATITGRLNAAEGVIDNLDTNYARINLANVNNAWIENGSIKDAAITTAKINDAAITTAKINNAAITTAKINDAAITTAKIADANVTTAKIAEASITNALIANEAVGDSKIASVSANKLTAGTIDASVVNVANLRADSLVVNRINGQPVFGGYVAVDSNASGYSEMNPSVQGWYEISNGQMVLSQDDEVDSNKAYYSTSESITVYDKDSVDGLVDQLNNRIDKTIETFSGEVPPTLQNYPYTDWYDTTTSPVMDNRAEHVGDIYYVVDGTYHSVDPSSSGYFSADPASRGWYELINGDYVRSEDTEVDSTKTYYAPNPADGYCYRFYHDASNDTYGWILIKDSDVTAALAYLGDMASLSGQYTVASFITHTDAELSNRQSAIDALRSDIGAHENYTQNTVAQQLTTNSSNISAFNQILQVNGITVNTTFSQDISNITQTQDSIRTSVYSLERQVGGYYAESSTGENIAAKVATIVPEFDNFTLSEGTYVNVSFTEANSVTSGVTLNVNSTGAKAIVGSDGEPLDSEDISWLAGSSMLLLYDGTSWVVQENGLAGRMQTAETNIEQTANNVVIRATSQASDFSSGGQSIIESLINVAPNNIKINANHLDITGTAVFNAINSSDGTTLIDGGLIDTERLIVGDRSVADTIRNTLFYKVSFAYGDPDRTEMTFTAHLYWGGEDIKESYDEDLFTWWLKSEDWVQGEPMTPLQSNGDYTCTIDVNDVGYGATVVGRFSTPEDAIILDDDDNGLTDDDDNPLAVRVPSGEYVRIRDLEVETAVFDTDKLLVVGSEDEHLVNVSTLKNVFGTKSYETLDDKPSIEDVTLISNKSFPDLGIFRTDAQGYSVADDYTLTTLDINALWANAQPIGG